MARGDMEESELLTRTCPRFDYRMNERGFAGRWLGAMDITLRMYIDIVAYQDGHAAGARYAWGEAGKEGEAPEWPPEVDEEAE